MDEKEKIIDNKSDIDTKKDVERKKNTSVKTCDFCGSKISKGNKFCTKCGVDVNKKKVEKKINKTNENSCSCSDITYVSKDNSAFKIVLLSSISTFIICIVFGFIFLNYFYDNNGHINTFNKNVTIDDTGIADAVEKVYDSVVVVENYVGGKLYGTGSGFVYKTDSKNAYILTNHHVIESANALKVVFTSDKKIDADVVGSDEFSDVAVLKVDKKYVSQIAITGDSDKMRIGDTTFAIGAPLDSSTYSWSVTRGVLSGKDRMVSTGSSYMNVIQTDTPINSGNSGGPLCNANGEVIGITNMKLASEQIEGMGFAIPIKIASEYADAFISGKKVQRPYIGVAISDETTSFFDQEIKVVVADVEDDSPAAKGGLKKGDIIKKIGNDSVNSSSYFKYKLYSYKVGDKVKITVERDGKEKELTITLGTNTKNA